MQENKFKLIAVTEFDWRYKEILHSNESPFREFREATKNDPILLASDMVDDGHFETKVLNEVDRGGKIAFLQEDSQISFRAEKDYCNFVYLKVRMESL